MKKLKKYLVIFWLSFFIVIFLMGISRHVALGGKKIKGIPKEIVLFLSDFVSNIQNFTTERKPMLVDNIYSLKNGFNYGKNYKVSNDYLLVGSWDDNLEQAVVKLIRIRDSKLIYKWTPDISQLNSIFNNTYTFGTKNEFSKEMSRLVHPLLNSDGSIIFGCGSIFKIDKNSKIVWFNSTTCHHSIERDSDSNLWICSYNSSTKNADKYQINDDAIKLISKLNGEILFERSVFEILMDNGYGRSSFFISPHIMAQAEAKHLDYIHLNDVEPVLYDSKYWKKGDLFLSLRNQNLVLLYRPSTNKVLWSKTGPWLMQHDVDIIDSCRISIFGNNFVDAEFPETRGGLIDGNNELYVYDFSKDEVSLPYHELFKTSKIGTVTQGLSSISKNGDIFVEETWKGRLVYGNYKEELWSYIEKVDEKHLSMFNWCRYITEGEFKEYTFINQ